ncbi:hypothetical protein E2P81_ATG05153 [Venturia nashicola]|uniref:Sequence orphan n=1 Tax=Venturia nashicola TaxID=86259 RepID=A0A4Z1P778_9PEZI|nr:hypothetical protein E6O75_ATG05280 [Venturia nashicola]TLD32177.1 hypothetical protein E2P81_ATG05153 [Venturia nashicola]
MKESGGDVGDVTASQAEAPAWKTPVAKAIPGTQPKGWNTRHLGLRIGTDALAAASAGVLVAPIITIIDRGIIENASGTTTLGASVRSSLQTLLLRPHSFFFSRPFGLIFALYTGTYLSANAIDTASSTIKPCRASATTHGTSKFAATSLTNLSLCLWKDTHFTRLFSPVAPRPLPYPTYVLFTLRDSLTIFASFNVPPILAPKLPMKLLPTFMKNVRSESIAQFLAPAAVQILSTPLHLLGLDFYNRKGTTSVIARWQVVRRAWFISCIARLGRIIPAFGVGGVVNNGVRRSLMRKLE